MATPSQEGPATGWPQGAGRVPEPGEPQSGEPQPPSAPAAPPWPQQPPPPGWSAPPSYGQAPSPPVDVLGRPLAEWWKRLVALIIDGLVAAIPGLVVGVPSLVAAISQVETDPFTDEITEGGGVLFAAIAVTVVVFVVSQFVYFSVLNGNARGQTVGKRVLEIQVRDADSGGPIGVGRGFIRELITWLLGLVSFGAFIDGLWPLWDQRRQTLHDKVANSVVVDVT